MKLPWMSLMMKFKKNLKSKFQIAEITTKIST